MTRAGLAPVKGDLADGMCFRKIVANGKSQASSHIFNFGCASEIVSGCDFAIQFGCAFRCGPAVYRIVWRNLVYAKRV